METFVGTFPYLPLQPHSPLIRVVRLEPGSFDSPIQCRLHHVDLDTRPKYEALSYVWGDPDATIPIELEAHSFPVTKNLECALRYLRYPDTVRILWIDAICIDQKNIPERNQQVQRMGRIYQSASKVILWVGEEQDDTVFGSPSSMPIEQIFKNITAIFHFGAEGAESHVTDLDSKSWMISLVGFVNREWFRRLWIIQEAVLNLDAELVCGHSSIPWLIFQRGFSDSTPTLKLPARSGMVMSDAVQNISTLWACSLWHYTWKEGKTDEGVADRIFRLLLLLDGQFGCSNPKDRLYGMLGIAAVDSETLLQTGLKVDYEKSAVDVFRDLAIFLIEQRSSLDILVGYDLEWEESDDLIQKPSWVPTWGENRYCSHRNIALSRLANKATPTTNFKISVAGDTLFLLGKEIGQLTIVGREFGGDRAALSEAFKEWEIGMLGSPLVNQRYKSHKDALEAWKHAFLHEDDEKERHLEHFCYDILAGHLDPATIIDGGEPEWAIERELLGFTSLASYRFANKWPFILSTGDIGLAEGVVRLEVDDLVCLFPGASFPFLMRREYGHYRFIGACYIHGFMEAEEQAEFLRQAQLVEYALH